jgi:copper chaperone CopZ
MSERIQLSVSGMGCSSCETAVSKAVNAACHGATDVEVDHVSGSVRYCCPDRSMTPRVLEAISEAGYEASLAD